MYPWFIALHHKLMRSAAAQSLHHALLINAKPGMGKHEFVHTLANDLLCHAPFNLTACGQCQSCLLNNAHTHPDRYVIASDKQISVNEIREALVKLHDHAQLSQRKVLIIEHADTMTEAAANALLKTLEEPTDNTYLLLTVSDIQRLLPTILSRCEKNSVTAPSAAEITSWLHDTHQQTVAEDMMRAYQYAPLSIATALLETPETNYLSFKQDLSAIKKGQMHSVSFAQKWHQQAYQCLGWLQLMLQSKCLKAPDDASRLHYLDVSEFVRTEMQRVHHQGINKRLVLSHVIDKVMS
jgi:DNA polymerase-3 subunit delta'